MNGTPRTVDELNNLPIKTVGNATIYLRDVATVSNGFAPQTNIVRQNGRRGVLVSIIKAGNASTISVVNGIRAMLPRVEQTLPPQLQIQPLADQSIFVKAAVAGVIREAVIAAGLTALMILIFLGSWRSTLIIAVSIPLSILTSIMVLSFIGQTINIMTLGGLALAVGILVDDATVTIENMERYLEEGYSLRDAILQRRVADRGAGAGLHAVHLYRVRADVPAGRRRALSVRAAGGSGGVRDARLLRAVAHAGADDGDVSAAGETAWRRRRRAIRWCGSSAASSGDSNGFVSPIAALLIVLVHRRGVFIPVFLIGLRCGLRAGAVARPGFLPEHRQRAVHPAHAGQDRHPHRGDRPARRSRRSTRSAGSFRRANMDNDPGQYRPALQQA